MLVTLIDKSLFVQFYVNFNASMYTYCYTLYHTDVLSVMRIVITKNRIMLNGFYTGARGQD